MKFSEAVAALERGEKITSKKWDKDQYIHLVDGNVKWKCGSYVSFGSDCLYTEWELYDDKVEVGTLKEGDLFDFSGF